LIILRCVFRFKANIFTRNINTFSQNKSQVKGFWLKYVVMPLVDKIYIKADHIINQCEAMRDDLLRLHPHLLKKTSVIYNPVSKHIEDFANSFDFNNVNKQDYLLCVGRLEKQKAFHQAIKAFAYLANDYPNLRLKIVGKGSLELYLKQFAFDLGIEDRVDFEGFQKDLIPYYLYAKATLLTSLYEGFPNVLLESIGLGTPVVAFDCPSGPKEIIIADTNGYLVKDKCLIDLNDKLRLTLNKNWETSIISETAKPYYLSNVIYKYEYFFNQY
jgi:glycosyltransferase involved in cell wall biosynthesis